MILADLTQDELVAEYNKSLELYNRASGWSQLRKYAIRMDAICCALDAKGVKL